VSAKDPDACGPGGANHSCDSNRWMLDERAVGARRDIAAGEELALDYALVTVASDWRMKRQGGSPLCRGVATSKDWQLPVLQERHIGHFWPVVVADGGKRPALQIRPAGGRIGRRSLPQFLQMGRCHRPTHRGRAESCTTVQRRLFFRSHHSAAR
jgi:hypothetical protein